MDYYDMSEVAIKAARKREITPVQSFVAQAIDLWESRDTLLSRVSPLAGDLLDLKSNLTQALSDGLIEGHGPDEASASLKILEDLTIPTSELDSLSELDPSGEFGEVQDYLRCLSRNEIFNEDLDTVWDFIIDVLECAQATVSLGESPVAMAGLS